MDLVGINEFARRKGVSHTLVGRALKNGRIVDTPVGSKKIDWDTQNVAFDNNCNLKFKLATKTRGDLAREAALGKGVRPLSEIPMPTPIVRPPSKVPERKAPVFSQPKPEKPAPVIEDPVIPVAEIPRAPKVPKPSKPSKRKEEPSQEDDADRDAEKRASQDRDTYNKARTAEQVIKAQLLDLELKQKRKELMPVPEVKKSVQKLAEFLMKGMQSIPDRICDEVAGMNDPSDINTLMTKEINNVLQEMGDTARGIAT